LIAEPPAELLELAGAAKALVKLAAGHVGYAKAVERREAATVVLRPLRQGEASTPGLLELFGRP
jgi:hypothetical protein